MLDGLAYLSGPVVADRLWSALGAADTLVVGSSSPVRDLDLAPVSDAPPTVYANRGLAGIDGTISTAIGVGLVVERPTHALVGDETFLDRYTTGLIVGRHEQRPDLRIVVANDNGGAIFATLEHGHPVHSGAYERIFGTPHDIDLERLGHRHRRRLPPGRDRRGAGRGAGRTAAGHRGGGSRHRPAAAADAGQRDRVADGRGLNRRVTASPLSPVPRPPQPYVFRPRTAIARP